MIIHGTNWETEMNCVVVLEELFLPARYALNFEIDMITEKSYEQAIGYERLKFLIGTLINNATFVDGYSKLNQILHEHTDTNIIECWSDPWDQFIGLMLLFKANAVLEDKIKIKSVSIRSLQDEGINFRFNYESLLAADPFDEEFKNRPVKIDAISIPWYYRSDTSLNDFILYDEDEKEHYHWAGLDWDDIGFGWKEPKEISEQSEGADKSNIIRMPFRPKIVR